MSAAVTRAVAMIVCVVAGALLVTASARSDDQRDLFDGPFASSSATKNGEPYAFVEGTRLRLEFVRNDGKPAISWHAGCNTFGMRVRISETRLDVRRVTSTEIGCMPALARQDRWLASFFSEDPAWRLRGDTLRLRTGDDRLRLTRRTPG